MRGAYNLPMAGFPKQHANLSAVPLFPLPNVVLFPRAVLPLHIFEERYKAMTADAITGQRLIAMALLKPGWEKCYYYKPKIDSVVCVGTILTHERLPDGTYNFLLQGHTRARIVREHCDETPSYRIAHLMPLESSPVLEIELSDERQRLVNLFEDTSLLSTTIGRQFQRVLASPFSTSDVADLIAFNFLDDIQLKQSLLADTDVRSRVRRTIDAFERIRPVPASAGFASGPNLN